MKPASDMSLPFAGWRDMVPVLAGLPYVATERGFIALAGVAAGLAWCHADVSASCH